MCSLACADADAFKHPTHPSTIPPPASTRAEQWLREQLETKHLIMAQTYGMHLPMRIRMELDILSQAKRLPGIRSSNIGAETILGRDETIDFEDYLGSKRTHPFSSQAARSAGASRFRTWPPRRLLARHPTPFVACPRLTLGS